MTHLFFTTNLHHIIISSVVRDFEERRATARGLARELISLRSTVEEVEEQFDSVVKCKRFKG